MDFGVYGVVQLAGRSGYNNRTRGKIGQNPLDGEVKRLSFASLGEDNRKKDLNPFVPVLFLLI